MEGAKQTHDEQSYRGHAELARHTRQPEALYYLAQDTLAEYLLGLQEGQVQEADLVAASVLMCGPLRFCAKLLPDSGVPPPPARVYRRIYWHDFWYADATAQLAFLRRGEEPERVSKFWALMPSAYLRLHHHIKRSLPEVRRYIPEVTYERYWRKCERYWERYVLRPYRTSEIRHLTEKAMPATGSPGLLGASARRLLKDIVADLEHAGRGLAQAAYLLVDKEVTVQGCAMAGGQWIPDIRLSEVPLADLPDACYEEPPREGSSS